MPGRARRNGSAYEPRCVGVNLRPLVHEVCDLLRHGRAIKELRFRCEVGFGHPLSPDGRLKLMPPIARYERKPGGRHDGVSRAPSFSRMAWTCDGARRADAILNCIFRKCEGNCLIVASATRNAAVQVARPAAQREWLEAAHRLFGSETAPQIARSSKSAARQAEIIQLFQRFEREANVRYLTIIGHSSKISAPGPYAMPSWKTAILSNAPRWS